MISLKLKDKVAVILGGGSWIGEAIAKKYALEGAKVVIAGPTLSKLEKTVNEIKKAGGYAFCEIIDVRNENLVDNFLKKVEQQHNQIDILVNSAAIYPRSTIESLSLSEWREVIDVNLTGAFIVLKYVSEIMKKNTNSKIIFNLHAHLLHPRGIHRCLLNRHIEQWNEDFRTFQREDLGPGVLVPQKFLEGVGLRQALQHPPLGCLSNRLLWRFHSLNEPGPHLRVVDVT